MKSVHAWALALACLLPMTAGAQWQWLDKNNKKVFSDQAPPLEIPDKNILRRPGEPAPRTGSSDAVPEGTSAPVAAAASARGAARPSGMDKELQDKPRKAEEAEKARSAAEEQKIARARADNCARARQGQATFDSGMRIARLNAQGEREIMDDNARAAEQQRLQSMIASDCN
ncbi:MAG: hypothetical protein JWQ03_348 [Variovorax sp.]|nr:hypothetical protein [Variovorax sp.]